MAGRQGKEGLEDATMKIVHLLQTHGQLGFRDIHEALKIDYRRAYDILNVLLTTPLLDKRGRKRDSRAPYIYQDGIPLSEVVEVDNVPSLISHEQQQINAVVHRLRRVEAMLLSPDPVPSPAAVFAELAQEDPSIRSMPQYMQFASSQSQASPPMPFDSSSPLSQYPSPGLPYGYPAPNHASDPAATAASARPASYNSMMMSPTSYGFPFAQGVYSPALSPRFVPAPPPTGSEASPPPAGGPAPGVPTHM